MSKELFRGLKKVINEIKTCPEIIVFINDNHLEAAKKIILILEKYPLFDIKLVFDEFIKVKNKLLLKNDYKPNYKVYKDIISAEVRSVDGNENIFFNVDAFANKVIEHLKENNLI